MLIKAIKTAIRIFPLYILLGIYFYFGFTTYRDFGATILENREYENGILLRNYLGRSTYDEDLVLELINTTPDERTSNPLFSVRYHGHSALLTLLNPGGEVEVYHLINIAFGSLLIVFSYITLLKKYNNALLASIGPVFVLLTPRLLGQIPINPIDLPFALTFFATISLIFLTNHTKNKFLDSIAFRIGLFGLLFGLLQSFNALGYAVYLIFALLATHNLLFRYKQSAKTTKLKYLKTVAMEIVGILLISHFFMMITWPFIGSNFVQNLSYFISNAFSTPATSFETFYLGKFVQLDQLPRNYFFVWLGITTPIITLILSALALVFIRNKIKDDLYFLYLSVLVVFFAVILGFDLHYSSGLRNFLFLLPIVAMFASITYIEILLESKSSVIKSAFVATVTIVLLQSAWSMYKLHPHQYIYFNESVENLGGGAELFEVDYYGTAFKDAADWIRKDIIITDPFDPKVYTCGNTFAMKYFSNNKYSITSEPEIADYLVCPYHSFDLEPSYRVVRDGVVLNNVSKVAIQ